MKFAEESCRCCLKPGMISLLDNSIHPTPILDMIEKCTGTSISLEDAVPQKICIQCFNCLIQCHMFIIKFLKVQKSLDAHLKANALVAMNNPSDHENSEPPSESAYDELNESVISLDDMKSESNASEDEAQYIEFQVTEDCNEVTLIDPNSDDVTFPLDDDMKSETNNSEDEMTSSQLIEFQVTDDSNGVTIIDSNEDDVTFPLELEKKGNNYCCLGCTESFELFKTLRDHCRETGHPYPKRYGCKLCSMKFFRRSSLRYHLRTHTKEKPYACDECDMKFSVVQNLQRHKKLHTGEKPYSCEICGRGFIQKQSLISHQRFHTGEKPFICSKCLKGFTTKSLLKQHERRHDIAENSSDEHYASVVEECNICKKLLSKSGLYNHMKTQHGDGLNSFLCNLCGKSYTTKYSFEAHMNTHAKISFKCEYCSKSFRYKSCLTTHMRVHSGRLHHCDKCEKAFTSNAKLVGHMRTHTGDKPFACTFCDRSFALNGNLTVHMRKHTGEISHECSFCGKGFYDASSRKKHEFTVHHRRREQNN